MSDMQDLFQDLILDHYKHPQNFRKLEHATACAEGHNPLCGDKVDIYLHLDGDIIDDISFEGSGCAISTASASLMTAELKGKSIDHARSVFREVTNMLTGKDERDDEAEFEHLGKLAALNGVSKFPVRVKCATLAWRTLEAALQRSAEPISTEHES